MLSCREETQLMSQRLDRPLSLGERFGLLFICYSAVAVVRLNNILPFCGLPHGLGESTMIVIQPRVKHLQL